MVSFQCIGESSSSHWFHTLDGKSSTFNEVTYARHYHRMPLIANLFFIAADTPLASHSSTSFAVVGRKTASRPSQPSYPPVVLAFRRFDYLDAIAFTKDEVSFTLTSEIVECCNEDC